MYIYWTVSLRRSGSKCLISLFVEVRQEKKIKDPGKILQAVSEQAAREAVLGLACLHGEEDFLGDAVGWRSQVCSKGWWWHGATCAAAAAGGVVLSVLALVSVPLLLSCPPPERGGHTLWAALPS